MANERHRIFIVEDEVLLAFEMTEVLEDMGFEVVGPSVHLSDAEETARTEQFDAAFLDVNLGGGTTSRPVAEILRERKVPFVFITAYDANEITFRMPDDKVVRKPVNSKTLLQTLRYVLPDIETPSPK